MWIFWTVIAIVGIAIVVAGAIVYLDGRKQRELEQAEKAELESKVGGDEVVVAPSPTETVEPEVVEVLEPQEPGTKVLVEPVVEPEPAVVEPEVERPEAPLSRWARLRRRLSTSNNALARALADLLSVDKIDADVWDDFETTLITSDLGVGPATELTEALRKRLAVDGVADPVKAKEILTEELLKLVDPSLDRSLNLTPANDGDPAVVLGVGVHGAGTTTPVG